MKTFLIIYFMYRGNGIGTNMISYNDLKSCESSMKTFLSTDTRAKAKDVYGDKLSTRAVKTYAKCIRF